MLQFCILHISVIHVLSLCASFLLRQEPKKVLWKTEEYQNFFALVSAGQNSTPEHFRRHILMRGCSRVPSQSGQFISRSALNWLNILFSQHVQPKILYLSYDNFRYLCLMYLFLSKCKQKQLMKKSLKKQPIHKALFRSTATYRLSVTGKPSVSQRDLKT